MSEVVKTLTATVRVIELSGKTRLTKQMFEQLNTNGFTSLDEIASRTSYLSIDDLIGKVNLFHAPGFLWALGRDNSTGELVRVNMASHKNEWKSLPLIVLGR